MGAGPSHIIRKAARVFVTAAMLALIANAFSSHAYAQASDAAAEAPAAQAQTAPTPAAPTAVAPTPAAPAAPPINQPFIDYFERLDETRWYVSDGWSNGNWMANDFRRSQLRITSEGLAITLARNPPSAPKPYSSGEIRTTTQYRYGYFEARMRVPRGSGHVTGFFTFTRPEGRPTWNEIDMEILGRDTRFIELVYWNAGRSKGRRVPLPFDAADGFHTYGFEWSPTRLRWYVDNRLIATADPRELAIPTRPQTVFMEFWSSQTMVGWLGPLRPQHAPWTLTVSCMGYAPRYEGRALCQARNPHAAAH